MAVRGLEVATVVAAVAAVPAAGMAREPSEGGLAGQAVVFSGDVIRVEPVYSRVHGMRLGGTLIH